MEAALRVVDYDYETLKKLLVEYSEANLQIITGKLHSLYFQEYFENIGAKTIVIEGKYIDRDFLDDYAGYYVKCFHEYAHKCARLHFFQTTFTQDDFTSFLSGVDSTLTKSFLSDNYLGFIVVKPLPKTVIGRTCLKTYPSSNASRNFPIIRDYSANLFGIELSVKTIAFQEQDHVVAACATSALWSAFQGTGMLFQHHIPSPVSITQMAVELMPLETRSLPSAGLTLYQMAHAIRKVGLEPFMIQSDYHYLLKSAIYAYLRGEIPIIAKFSLYDVSSKTNPRFMGLHAVAITGYRLDSSTPTPYGATGFLSKATQITRIYAHDDQVGPFARMIFDDTKVIMGNERYLESLLTSWLDENGSMGNVRAAEFALLVPLYHKIRIPFQLIETTVVRFDALLNTLINARAINLTQRCEWEIYLTTVNRFKKALLENNDLDSAERFKILDSEFPRFIWLATAYQTDTRMFDLLFDATDIEQGNFFVRAVVYDQSLDFTLKKISKQPSVREKVSSTLEGRILDWFSKQ